jgi:hypothetical protein
MKKLKFLICAIVSAVALNLSGVTPEEARRIIQENLEIISNTQKEIRNETVDRMPLYQKQRLAWDKIESLQYGAFPALYALLDEEFEAYWSFAASRFLHIDGENLASEGEKEALEWTRKILKKKPINEFSLLDYLAMKSDDARDVETLRKSVYYRTAEILAMRVAGTNVFNGVYNIAHVDNEDIPKFHPSVANTGPQAIYVREILMKAWELFGGAEYDPKIPVEILTMVVSFNKDGNPVSSVDLAKYGLSMPVITPKPDKYYRGEYKVVFPHEADTAQTGGMNSNTVPKVTSSPTIRINEKNNMETSSPNRPWLYIAIAVSILGIGGFYVWRKKKTRN